MSCCLVGAKPLSDPMMQYHQFTPWQHIPVKSYAKFIIFIQENVIGNVVCEMAAILSQPQCVHMLTHWCWDKMDAISQTTFRSTFSWMKMFEIRLKFHWSLFLRVQLTIFQHWFRKWLGAVQVTTHFRNQWWLDYRRIYASLVLNELRYQLVTVQIFNNSLNAYMYILLSK